MVCSPSTVQVHPHQNMTVLCRVEPPFNLRNETLEWRRGSDVVHVYRSGGDNYDDQNPMFKGRTSLIHQNLKDGNVSLTLTNVNKEDEGAYTCCLRTQNPVMCSNVTLTVGSTLSSGEITAIVLGVLGVLGVFGVVGVLLGVAVVGMILAFILYKRNRNRNRNRTDLHPGSASITLRKCFTSASNQMMSIQSPFFRKVPLPCWNQTSPVSSDWSKSVQVIVPTVTTVANQE